jgi:hypothetical protein
MNVSRHRRTRARGPATLVLALAGAAVIGGCGTPAVIKPSATPLPGLQRDIRAAQSVVAKTEREAQSDASANASSP